MELFPPLSEHSKEIVFFRLVDEQSILAILEMAPRGQIPNDVKHSDYEVSDRSGKIQAKLLFKCATSHPAPNFCPKPSVFSSSGQAPALCSLLKTRDRPVRSKIWMERG